MALKAAIATARKAAPKTGSSDKNPAYYTKKKGIFIRNMCEHSDPVVRIAALTNVNCPISRVSIAMESESDKNVLRALLLSGRPTIKSIIAFVETDRASMFDNDQEVEDYITCLISGTPLEEPNSDSSDVGVIDDDDSIFENDED